MTIHVHRAGRLARLGHNHVITSGHETGVAWSKGEPVGSGFELRVPVAAFVVDDPAARAAAGADFPGQLSDAAREGTRRNMLRAEVLDGERHPEVVIRGSVVRGTWERPFVAAEITVKGRTREFDVPLSVQRDAQSLTVRGGIRILQSDFGITPFSVAGGAIQVADAVDVAFEFGLLAAGRE